MSLIFTGRLMMIKRGFKAIGLVLVFGLSLSSLYLVNLFVMKPVSIDHFLNKELLTGLADSPEAMTYLGIFDQFNWFTKHNSKLSIPNPEDNQADIKDAKKTLKILNKYITIQSNLFFKYQHIFKISF